MAKLWDRLRRRFGGHDELESDLAHVNGESVESVALAVTNEVTVVDATGASGVAPRDDGASPNAGSVSFPAAQWSSEVIISRDIALMSDQPAVIQQPPIVESVSDPWEGTAGASLSELAEYAREDVVPDVPSDTAEAPGRVLLEPTARANDESDSGEQEISEPVHDVGDAWQEEPESISADEVEEVEEEAIASPEPERRRRRRREPSELDGQPARLVLPGRPLKRKEVPTLDTPLLLWSHDADGTVVVQPHLYACVQTQWYGSSLYFLVIPWSERDEPSRSARLVVDATQLRVAPAEMVH